MSAKFSDLLKTIECELEVDVQYLTELQKKIGRKACGCIYIYDMEGLTFAKATDKRTIEDFITFAKIYQDNYPELLKAAIVINASVYFSLPFSIVKSFLGGSIIDKISIYTTDSWKEALLEQFDADQLPAFLGGTKTDPDGNPLCLTTILHGGPVPEKYYIHKSKKSLAQAEGVKKITLSRASFSEEKVEVKEAGSLLEWEFETKCRDIGFGLFYQEVADGEEKITELVPRERIDTEEYAETGMYKCEKAGTYIMLFDNTYSWIRSKEIYYRVTLVSPKEHEARLSA
ncbi:SEC14-like protein 2 [Stegodyphus dumicola]|uniref:SEC14-like protein 2 n=1 Tax=Stegodyphus dumicola TaxID=202533 RepID=UPI0015AD9D6E|nr:SEC14-like protein 2 [Stegodyphus dumicola]